MPRNSTVTDRRRPRHAPPTPRRSSPSTENKVLEGAPAESVTIAQFPDMAAAKAWYDSPEYQDAKQHRLSGADFRIILTEGL